MKNCASQGLHSVRPSVVQLKVRLIRPTCCQAQQEEPQESHSDRPYKYNAGKSQEKNKATIEHVYGGLTSSKGPESVSSAHAPWAMGWQMNERNIVWNDDLKLRLLKVLYLYNSRMRSRYLASGRFNPDYFCLLVEKTNHILK
jgi:hypothetical protein